MASNLTGNSTQTRAGCLLGMDLMNLGVADTVTWAFVSIITVTGNSKSIKMLLSSQRMHLSYNIYLISLLTSNLLFGLVIHPMFAYESLSSVTNCFSAKAVRAFAALNILVSLLSSLAIAINRYKALNFKNTRSFNRMQAQVTSRYQRKVSMITVAVIWFVAALIFVICLYRKQGFQRFHLWVSLLLITTVTVQTIITFKLRKVSRRVSTKLLQKQAAYKKLSRSIRLLRFIILSTLITKLPAGIMRMIDNYTPVNKTVVSIVSRMYLLTPMIDPICYVIFQ